MPNKCGLFKVISFVLTTPLWVREKVCVSCSVVERSRFREPGWSLADQAVGLPQRGSVGVRAHLYVSNCRCKRRVYPVKSAEGEATTKFPRALLWIWVGWSSPDRVQEKTHGQGLHRFLAVFLELGTQWMLRKWSFSIKLQTINEAEIWDCLQNNSN